MSPQQTIEAVKENASRLVSALPASIPAETLIQIFSVMVYKTPKLCECDRESIITGLIQGGTLGLNFTPGMNEAHLIPRWNWKLRVYEAQFQPGYKGLEKLAINTGTVVYIQPREVCKNDLFEVTHEDDKTHILHKPNYRADRGKITHVYAFAKMANGDPLIEVMTEDEIEGIHKRSEGYIYAQKEGKEEVGPWVADRKEMELKTVTKRICKRLPRSSDAAKAKAFEALNTAIQADDRQYQLEDQTPEHHAINHDNQTGHGSGAYAPPDIVNAYSKWLAGYVERVNAHWYKTWTKKYGEGDARFLAFNKGGLLSTYQTEGHLVKWARAKEILNLPESPKMAQRAKFLAVAWERNQDLIEQEARDYARLQSELATTKILMPSVPRPEPEDESQERPDDDAPEPDIDAAAGFVDEPFEEGRE